MPEKQPIKKNHQNGYKWIYAILPVNIAFGPITTFIALYILNLGGNVIDVSYTITLGYLILIPASFFWGKISGLYDKRKIFLGLSYMGMGLSFLGMFLTSNMTYIIILYIFLYFFNTANIIPLNLLSMDMAPKDKWTESFSKYQVVIGIGASIGLILASIITSFITIKYLVIVFSALSFVSAILSLKYIKEIKSDSNNKSFIKITLSVILQFIVWPTSLIRPSKYKSLIKVFRNHAISRIRQNYLSILIIASFIFFLGSGLFNTIYPAGLKQYGLHNYTIFLIFFIAQFVQTILFFYTGKLLKNKSKDKVSSKSLVVRGVSYILISLIFIFLANAYFVYANILIYLLAAGVAYSFYYIASNTLFFEAMNNIDRSRTLGIYSAITSAGLFIGSFISGYLVYFINYWVVFLIAGILMLISAFMFMFLPKRMIIAIGK
jgi:MFS family permease